MKFLPVTILLALCITGCKSEDPLDFISDYHAYAEKCGTSIDAYHNENTSREAAEQSCEDYVKRAKYFDKHLSNVLLSHPKAIENSKAHQTMLNDIMVAGFKYQAMESAKEDSLVVLTEPQIIRMVTHQ